ncbi:MAG TPA: hypothetical protein VM939_09120, partial [Gemmatimonadaceae bacterium]|nr:hypothetical protein [Gemmatimonadaceae bacterium]
HVRDNFSLGSWGVWTFGSVEALEKRAPSRYEVSLPLNERGPIADYSSLLLSAYAQDQWWVTRSFSVTAGVRADIPVFDSPVTNDSLAANDLLGRIDTGVFPSGNVLIAPRIGFAWRFGHDNSSLLRGGAGIFAGRPPLAWLTGAFSSTGQEQTTLICEAADGVPAPVTNVAQLPKSCLGNNTTTLPGVSYFDRAFHFQSAHKYAIGLERHFGESFQTSLDIVYTTTRNNLFMRDVNLVQQQPSTEGRAMYGRVSSSGVVSPARVDARYGPVFRYDNVDSDRSAAVSIAADRSWRSGGRVHVGYNWSRTQDAMSLSGLISSAIWRSNPVDGTLVERPLRRSARDIPHSFVATAFFPARFSTTVSAFLRARSGTPYAFSINGDANADGASGNDLVYIPAGPDDISLLNPDTYRALDSLIRRKTCLARQRGGLMKRNSCRNPFVTSLDGRVSKKFHGRASRGFEVSADLFNIPNMLNSNWGLLRETASREETGLVTLVGWDAARNRPRYSIPVSESKVVLLPPIDKVVTDLSRWRVQLGARYDF